MKRGRAKKGTVSKVEAKEWDRGVVGGKCIKRKKGKEEERGCRRGCRCRMEKQREVDGGDQEYEQKGNKFKKKEQLRKK